MASLGRSPASAPLTSADIPAGSVSAVKVASDVATQAEIDLKAPLANPTFTGAVLGTPLSHRNMIINGGMQVSQRNGTSSFALTNGKFGTDRWKYNGDSSRLTAQQVADAPAGFHYSLKLASVGNNSPGSTAGSGMWMQLEGDDVTRLSYGTNSAKTVTLSFYVKSSIAGNFGGAFSNGAMNRAYPFTFPVTTSWNRVSITIAGDTTGTWITSGTGYGLRVILNSASGSNFNGSNAGAWVGADRRDVSGTVQLEATNGATLNITGAQLEEGSVATPFEHRSFGDELTRCQRYYQIVPAGMHGLPGFAANSTTMKITYPLAVPLRVTPTTSIMGAGSAFAVGAARAYGSGAPTIGKYDPHICIIGINKVGFTGLNSNTFYSFYTGSTGTTLDSEL